MQKPVVLGELVASSEVIPVAVMCGKLLASDFDLWIWAAARFTTAPLVLYFRYSQAGRNALNSAAFAEHVSIRSCHVVASHASLA